MKNETEKLIKKYKKELMLNERLYTTVESSTPTKNIINDLEFLLKLYRSGITPEIIQESIKTIEGECMQRILGAFTNTKKIKKAILFLVRFAKLSEEQIKEAYKRGWDDHLKESGGI